MREVCGVPILALRVGIKIERARRWLLGLGRRRARVFMPIDPPIISQNDRRAPWGAASVLDTWAGPVKVHAPEDWETVRRDAALAQRVAGRRASHPQPMERGVPRPARHYWS